MNDDDIPQLIFEQHGETREILNPELFEQLSQEAE